MSNSRTNSLGEQQSEQLDWLAFCYVHDDLSEDDRAEFEVRLADEQQAREAVARAVRLADTIRIAEISLDGRSAMLADAPVNSLPEGSLARRNWLAAAAWMTAGAALCLAVVLSVQAWNPGGGEPGLANNTRERPQEQVPPQDAPAVTVATAWAEILDARAEQDVLDTSSTGGEAGSPELLTPLSLVESLEDPDSDVAADPLAAIDNVTTPDWLLAAVGGQEGDDGNHDGNDGGRTPPDSNEY